MQLTTLSYTSKYVSIKSEGNNEYTTKMCQHIAKASRKYFNLFQPNLELKQNMYISTIR